MGCLGDLPGHVLDGVGKVVRAESVAAHGMTFRGEGTLVFLVIALIAGLLGFGGLASGAAGIAKVLFGVFVVLAVISAIAGLFKR